MADKSILERDPGPVFEGLRVADAAVPGWSVNRHLREPFFLKALALYTLFGMIVGGLYYLFHSGRISFETKDLHVLSTYLVVFGGGLYLQGKLTARRAALLLVAAVMDQVWLYYFWDKYPMNLLNILVGNWLIFWWVLFRPDLMARFGLRRYRIGRDLLVGAGLSLVLFIYMVPLFMIYDFALTVKGSEILSYVANAMPQNLMNYSVMFSVWHTLERRGISHLGGMAAIAAMVFAQQIFTWSELWVNGVVAPGMIVGGMLAMLMLMVLVFGITFRVFRNTLPAVFVVTTIQICLVMTGMVQ